MATYTANLRFVLQAAGENNNTWGTVFNTGATALIDSAISGLATVTMPDANYTLTTANGATDEARQAILNITGTLTANRNVVCPAVSKTYIIINNTTGGWNITLTTGSGGTVTILNGTKQFVYCDGTNVSQVSASFSGGTLSSELITVGSGTGGSGLNLPHGTAPTSPVNGDIWTTTSGLFYRISGVTVTPMIGSNNLSEISSAPTARANLGLGSAATQATGTFLQTANNLSEVTASTARTNLGLGTAATQGTGTSGATIPFLNGVNTWSGLQSFNSGANLTPASTPATNAVGYLGLPQNSISAGYTTVMADAGKHILHSSASPHTVTIAANSSVAYPIGTVMKVGATGGGTVTLAITSDTLTWLPTGGTGSRTITSPGFAVVEKIAATTWWVTGTNLT